jgi:hypothetical protein
MQKRFGKTKGCDYAFAQRKLTHNALETKITHKSAFTPKEALTTNWLRPPHGARRFPSEIGGLRAFNFPKLTFKQFPQLIGVLSASRLASGWLNE